GKAQVQRLRELFGTRGSGGLGGEFVQLFAQRGIGQGKQVTMHQEIDRHAEADEDQRQDPAVPEGQPPANAQASHWLSFKTYPTPRTVWMSGVRPIRSTFLRSALM